MKDILPLKGIRIVAFECKLLLEVEKMRGDHALEVCLFSMKILKSVIKKY